MGLRIILWHVLPTSWQFYNTLQLGYLKKHCKARTTLCVWFIIFVFFLWVDEIMNEDKVCHRTFEWACMRVWACVFIFGLLVVAESAINMNVTWRNAAMYSIYRLKSSKMQTILDHLKCSSNSLQPFIKQQMSYLFVHISLIYTRNFFIVWVKKVSI